MNHQQNRNVRKLSDSEILLEEIIVSSSSEEFLRGEIDRFLAYSCFTSPNAKIVKYERILYDLILDVSASTKLRQTKQGSTLSQIRGLIFLEAFSSLIITS